MNNDNPNPHFRITTKSTGYDITEDSSAEFIRPGSNKTYTAQDVDRVFTALEEIARSGAGKSFPSDNQMMARETLESVRGYV